MSVVTLVLVFLLAVIVSVFVSRLLKDIIPLPIIQIALGAALSAFGFVVEFEPHLFLFLFIPPLLFLSWMAGVFLRKRYSKRLSQLCHWR